MSILAECPLCRKRQSLRNQKCVCGEDLNRAKRSGRVKYWITYRVQGKQRTEAVGSSLEEARKAEGKRKVQKREGKFFEMLPESKITFQGLTKWYEEDSGYLTGLRSADRVKTCLKLFNITFGETHLKDIKPQTLREYQAKRKREGAKPRTIDYEMSVVKTMLTRAFDNEKIDGKALRAFRVTKNLLRKGANARRRVMAIEEYLRLIEVAPLHLRTALIIALNTGMRLGEIRALQWKYVDRKKGFIRLPAGLTKEAKGKTIPLNHHIETLLDVLPHALHKAEVITFQGEPMTAKDGFKGSFETACIKAKIPYGRDTVDGLIFHDIRRSTKTYMVQAGVDKALRDIILGHSLQGMDAHYLAPTEEHLKAAMDRYTQWLDAQLDESRAKLEKNSLKG